MKKEPRAKRLIGWRITVRRIPDVTLTALSVAGMRQA
jgi:hypothetical protein